MLPDAGGRSVILVPQPNRVRTTPCYKRTYNFAVSKIGQGRKWFGSWSLTNLPFALAPLAPHTKLIPSS